MLIRVQVCVCAAYNEYRNLLNLYILSLSLRCIMSLRTRYGKLEKALKIKDYSFKKCRSE